MVVSHNIGTSTEEQTAQEYTFERYLYPEFYDSYNDDEITNAIEQSNDVVSIDNVVEEPVQPLVGLMDSAWPMYGHDVRHTGRSPYSTADNPFTEKWRYFSEGWIEENPTIDNNGNLYIQGYNHYAGDPFYFKSINPNGTLKWAVKADNIIWGSAPAIAEDGTVYACSWDCKIRAINPNGTIKWKTDIGGSIFSSPAIAEDGTIYVGHLDDRICALNPNGTIKWRYKTGNNVASSPAIGDDGTIYIGSEDEYFYALYPNGTLRWRFKTGDEIHGSPSIADDGIIYFPSFDDYLYALYPNGTMKWKYYTGFGASGAPAIGNDGIIYVGTNKLYAIYPNGTLKWSFNLGSDRYIGKSSPAISADGTIFIGTKIYNYEGGEILAINHDGTERWRKRLCSNVWVGSSPSIGEDGTVYIGSAYDLEFQNPGWWTGVGCLHAFGNITSNNPPTKPTRKGSSSGKVGETYLLKCQAKDPDINPIYFHIEWGDGTIQDYGPYASGEPRFIRHKWKLPGNLTLKIKAKDEFGGESNWTTLIVNVIPRNYAPDKPIIDGPVYGKIKTEYNFTAVTNDFNGDNVSYYFSWGDGKNSGWTEFVSSGNSISLNHSWKFPFIYIIKVKAKDEYGLESEWGELRITMPRDKSINNLLSRFLEKYPFLYQLLQFMLQRLGL